MKKYHLSVCCLTGRVPRWWKCSPKRVASPESIFARFEHRPWTHKTALNPLAAVRHASRRIILSLAANTQNTLHYNTNIVQVRKSYIWFTSTLQIRANWFFRGKGWKGNGFEQWACKPGGKLARTYQPVIYQKIWPQFLPWLQLEFLLIAAGISIQPGPQRVGSTLQKHILRQICFETHVRVLSYNW